MASSSFGTSSVKYDVFLSFRGLDTRDNFTSHLYAALCRERIKTFIDYELRREDEVSPSILNAIEDSKISVIIFSKGYASSPWCLNELVKIIECKKNGQTVIPVFYHVDPSDVRNQTGTFEEELAKLEKCFEESSGKLQTWRTALIEAANLSGFDSNITGFESHLVEEIVKHILKIMNHTHPNDNNGLFGVQSSIKKIESLLCVGLNDVCMVGIWGMGGIGKTTIARVVYNKIQGQFEDSYFALNVRETSDSPNGLASLQQELLSTILKDRHSNLGLSFRKQRLGHKKVLIVFDDVTCPEQIKELIGDLKHLGPGSRIIITTRDKHVLMGCGVDNSNIYWVEGLCYDDALRLFRQYAFRQSHPIEDYRELSNKIVRFSKGVPLALKVLGSSLRGKKKQEWEHVMKELEVSYHMGYHKMLTISFDGLDNIEKEIFLDIACFFKGWDSELVKSILDARGFSSHIGISRLIDKSFITILNNTITMHDMLQEIGREIVRLESLNDPGKRSRLWHHEDVYHVLTKNMATDAIEGIFLDMSRSGEIHLNPLAFSKMRNLRFLSLYSSGREETNNKVHGFQGLEYDFTELRFLYWHRYPLKSLLSNFHPEKLVALKMPHSNIQQLWTGVQNLVNLKYIDLSYSKHLLESPDLSCAPNLEGLNLEGCSSLFELSSSIRFLNKLVILNLRHCKSLHSLPMEIDTKSLRKFILSDCSSLKMVPKISCKIEELYLDGTAIKELPSSIDDLSSLVKLDLSRCSRLESLPNSFCKLKSLKDLYLSGCSKLERLPYDLGNLATLEILEANEIPITEVPSSIANLKSLNTLSFKGCRGLEIAGLRPPYLSGLHFLVELNMSDCNIMELPESLGHLSSLESLCVARNNFESIPISITNLSKLMLLDVSFCNRLQYLLELPFHLEYVKAQSCTSLQELFSLSILFMGMKGSQDRALSFINCFKLDSEALRNTLNDALLNIQQNTSHWLEVSETVWNNAKGFMFFPGSEITEWFNFQSTGCYIELTRGLLNHNFIGLAFCTVIAFQDYHDDGQELIVNYELLLKHKDGCYKKVAGGFFWGWNKDDGPGCIELDHVFLGYDCNMNPLGFHEFSYNSEAIVNFYVSNNDRIHLECCKVKKCGVRLFCAEDFGKPMEECHRSLISNKEEKVEPFANSSNLQVKYDVFLNFRGEDTRDNFTSHLHAALCRSKIEAFIDNEDDKLIGQDKNSSCLLNAIEESMISIIIFSEGYASSRCCLEELVKILECKKRYGQVVIPVFYRIDPSHVRNQTGIFGNAFAKLEECFKDQLEIIQTWRIALREAANLSGFDSSAIRCESVLVEEIVKHVLKLLNHMFPSANKDLVGVQLSIKKIESLICMGLKDVCIVGIWGMGGVGKTAIARVVFEEIYSQFDASYFAPNVREQYESPNRITFLRQELLSELLNDRYLDIGFTFIKQRLGRKKVLIVFDDVTSLEQIELLIGDLNCLGVGSRIIITTRYRQVLKNCGVDDDNMYLVEALFHREALQLFSWYAFQHNRPTFGYYELSNKVVQYTKGIPLALKVLGSFLLGKTKRVWESAIDKLKRVPGKDIQMMLKVSYDGLDDDEKNIFLDIACFLKWEDRDFVIKFLDVSGFFAEIGVSVLIDKCLITILNNKITMHDLLQEMGWEIVKKESIEDPGSRSRLQYHKDIYDVLKNNMGTKAIEGICLDMSKVTRIDLNHRAFAEMYNLRFLKVYNSHCEENNINKVYVPGDFEFIFTELRYLCWHGCPLESLDLNFQSENLVALDMPNSNVEKLWAGDQHFDNLKHINLSHSKHLLIIPDLSVAPNLESLILEGCTRLSEISLSIKSLSKLVILNLRQCKSLRSLPMGIQLKSLKKVILSCCSNLKMFPEVSGNIEELFLDETAIEELPPSIGNLSRLVTLNLKNCSYLENLPTNFCQLKSLEHLALSGCSKLNGLPDCLRNLEALKVLEAGRFPIREVLSSIMNLCSLMELNLTGSDIMELPSCLGQLLSLESLLLGRNKFESIPTSIIDLLKLSYLDLSYCERLQSLPELPDHLQYLGAQSCTSLEASSGLSILLPTVSRNASVNFINCFKLDQNALINIVKDVLQIIQDTPMEFFPRPSAYICFPGTEIPGWFTSQDMGSSIKFELSLGGFNPGLVSFAVCAIVEFGNYHGRGLVVGCDCKLGSRDGTVVMYYDIGPHPVDSDHIFLGYDLHMCSFDFNESRYNDKNEVSIQFYVEDLNNKRIDYCEVKKCGVYLLYYPKIGNLEEVTVNEGLPSKKLKRA